MIKLHGVPLSPYYNKVKIALLEKGVNFQEVLSPPSQEEWLLEKSPMGKIPFIEVNGHAIAESSVILEWLEDAYPTASLLPPTPNGRAHARELSAMLTLYVQEPAMPLLRHWLFGRPLSDEGKEEARSRIARGIAAVAQLAHYGPWLTGEEFSIADISAACVLPLLETLARQQLLAEDPVALLPWKDEYLARLKSRQSVQRTLMEQAGAVEAYLARRQQG